eukprot:3297425-Prymnesium_polylepis.1
MTYRLFPTDRPVRCGALPPLNLSKAFDPDHFSVLDHLPFLVLEHDRVNAEKCPSARAWDPAVERPTQLVCIYERARGSPSSPIGRGRPRH